MKSRLLCLLVVLVLPIRTALLCAAGPSTTFRGSTMGTTFEIKFDHYDSRESIDGKKIKSRLDEINARMSTYIDDSEVCRFNRAAANEWFPVSAETAHVVQRAQEISRQTDGAFDITVGPLIRLWNFGAGSQAVATLPKNSEIEAVRRIVGYQKLEVRESPPALRKSVAGLEIDLSAIAKGYAVDELARILDEEAIEAYMVEIGGEIRVRTSYEQRHWTIGIESPIVDVRRIHKVFFLEGTTALATSGDYRNFHEIEGKRYSHTIDPQTARPVDHHLASATVNTPDCLSADAYATALMVMGPTRGSKWAEENQIAAFLLVRNGASVIEHRTSHFALKSSQKNAARRELSRREVMMISLVFFAIAVCAMAIGVIVSNRRLKGSCGGLAGFTDTEGNSICDACTNPSPECRGVETQTEPD